LQSGAATSSYSLHADLSPELLALGFIWYVAFLFSTTCHEAAHRWPPNRGTNTAFAADRYRSIRSRTSSANPGMVVFPILSLVLTGSLFGWPARHTIAVERRQSPTGRVDGARRSGHELHADADRGADTAPRVDLPLAAVDQPAAVRDFPHERPLAFLLP